MDWSQIEVGKFDRNRLSSLHRNQAMARCRGGKAGVRDHDQRADETLTLDISDVPTKQRFANIQKIVQVAGRLLMKTRIFQTGQNSAQYLLNQQRGR